MAVSHIAHIMNQGKFKGNATYTNTYIYIGFVLETKRKYS